MKKRFPFLLLSLIVVLGCQITSLEQEAGPDPAPDIPVETAPETASVTPDPASAGQPPTATAAASIDDPDSSQWIEVHLSDGTVALREPLPPTDYYDLLWANVDAGLWSEVDGLILLLRWMTGEINPEDHPTLIPVLRPAATRLLNHAQTLIDSGQLDIESELELLRLLAILVPGKGVLDQISEKAPTSSAEFAIPISSKNRQDQTCQQLAALGYPEEDIQTGPVCFYQEEILLEGGMNWIYYPADWQAQPDRLFQVGLAKLALEKSAQTYSQWGVFLSAHIVFSPHYLLASEPDDTWAYAMRGPTRESCAVALSGQATTETDKQFMQIVAHELFHCVQFWTIGSFDMGQADWWMEGSAEYFSNVVVPDGDLEHRLIENFNAKSNVYSIFEMSYENFAFFQHLANQVGNQAVVDLLREVAGLGRASAEANLRRKPYMQGLFHQMFVSFLSTGIPDPGGTPIRSADVRVRENYDVEDAGDESFSADPFVGVRIGLVYGLEKRFLQSGQLNGDGLNSAVLDRLRADPSAWSSLPEEVRTSCNARSPYILLLTSTQEQTRYELTVSQMERASCDPCLLGNWIVDHESLSSYIENHPDLQDGGGLDLTISGGYYLTFNELGLLSSLRSNFTTDWEGTSEGQTFNFRTVVNASGSGNYSADGENLKIWNWLEAYANITGFADGVVISLGNELTDISFFGVQSTVNESVGSYSREDQQADYSCDLTGLEMMNASGVVRWERVDEIPPTAVPTPFDAPTPEP